MNNKKHRKKKDKNRNKKRGAQQRKRKFLDLRDLPELKQARALWSKNRFQDALTLFDKTARKNPMNALALIDGARAFGDRYEFRRAEELISKLVGHAEKNGKLLQMAGQTYRMIGRPNKSIECLEQAVSVDPDLFEARLELALLYDRFNDLEKGLVHAEECIERHGAPSEALYLKGQLLRRSKRTEESRLILESLAKDDTVHVLVRTKSYFELGYIYDKQEDYAKAFEVVSAAKKLQFDASAPARKEADRESKGFENLFEQLESNDFQRWKSELDGITEEQFVFLTGSPRSGTTLLERVIGSHPDVTSTDEEVALSRYILPNLIRYKKKEELGVDNLDSIPRSKILDQRQRYFRYMSHLLNTNIQSGMHVDKNPSLVRLMPAVLRLFPETKVLFALRDPRDIVVSCFLRFLPINSVSVNYQTMSGTIESVTTEIRTWIQLKRMIPNEFFEIRYEDMVAELKQTSEGLVDFLELEWSDEILNYRESKKEMVNSPTYEDVAKPVYKSSVGRWQNYQSFFGSELNELNLFAKELGY